MKLRWLLTINTYISWVIMLIMSLLMGIAYAMDGLPYPIIAVVVTLCGLIWSMAGFVFCVMSLYMAWRKQLLGLWALSFSMSAMSCYAFFILASMY